MSKATGDSLRKASVASLLGSMATLMFGTGTNILVARALGPSLKGTYAVFLNTQGIIMVPAFALQTALIWYIANHAPSWDRLKPLIYRVAIIQAVISVALVYGLIQLPGLHTFLLAGLSPLYLVPLFVVILLSCLAAYRSALLPALQQFTSFTVWGTGIAIASSSILLGGLAALWWLGRGLTIPALVTLTTIGVAVGTIAWIVRTSSVEVPESTTLTQDHTIQTTGRFAWPVFLRNVVEWMNYRVDVYLVNAFVSTREVGLYTVATGLAQQLWIVPFAVSEPLFSRVSASGDTLDSRQVTQYAFRVTLLISVALGIAMAVIIPFLVPLVYGERFAGTTPMFLLLLPGVVTVGPSRTLSSYLAGSARPGEPLRAESVGLCATIVLDLLLIPRLGGRGAAGASSVAYALYTVVLCWRFVKLSGSTWAGLLVWRRADTDRLGSTCRDMGQALARRVALLGL